MDPVVKTLMERYHMTREQAEVYAGTLSKKLIPSPMDRAVQHEANTAAFNRTVVPQIERAKRIHYFNQLNERHMAGEQLDPVDLEWLNQVKAAEAKRMKERAAAMVAAKKLTALTAPAASDLVGRLPVPQHPQQPVQMAPRVVPDPTRYAALPPAQAFVESFRDNSVAPPAIDAASGAPIGSADYYAFHARQPETTIQAPLDIEIGPVQLDPDIEALRAWDDPGAVARRKANASYWDSERGKARIAEMDELRKRVAAKMKK